MFLIWYLIATLIISTCIGLSLLTKPFIIKYIKSKWIDTYVFVFWFFIAFLIIYFVSPNKLPIFNFENFSYNHIIIFVLTILITNLIINQKNSNKTKVFISFINGVLMEIPQRLCIQYFFLITVTIEWFNLPILAILLNALIWVQFIIIQEVIINKKRSKKIIKELAASFVFSLGTGYLFAVTYNIFVTMLAHGFQRLFTKVFGKSINSN